VTNDVVNSIRRVESEESDCVAARRESNEFSENFYFGQVIVSSIIVIESNLPPAKISTCQAAFNQE
jgi:hypothetical protein